MRAGRLRIGRGQKRRPSYLRWTECLAEMEIVVVGAAKVPVSVPTVTVVSAATVGKPVEMVNVPSPLSSVVSVPTTVAPTVTVSEASAAAPVTLIAKEAFFAA